MWSLFKKEPANIYTLEILGMGCGACEAHVNDVIRRNLKVKKVKSSHLKNQTIVISVDEITEEAFHKIIDPTGYQLISVKKDRK